MARQIPLTCSGHTRPVVHLSFSDITPYGYFLISACKGELADQSSKVLRHFPRLSRLYILSDKPPVILYGFDKESLYFRVENAFRF